MAMTPGEIKRLLTAERIQLTKALGQNFLHDPNQIRRIVDEAHLTNSDRVLEIGPGLGALTQVLLERVPHVLAIEMDHRLYRYLRKRISDEGRLTLMHADALDYLRTQNPDLSDWKVVSNLPYSVASLLLVEFAKTPNPPRRLAVTLQFEVAQRLTASAGDEQYGVLTLLVRLRYQPAIAFKIPPECFFPAPEIHSACVTLEKRLEPPLPPTRFKAFEKIVKRGFSQRRKMMMKLLKADWPLAKIEDAFARLGLSPQVRAESVTFEQHVELTKLLAPDQIEP